MDNYPKPVDKPAPKCREQVPRKHLLPNLGSRWGQNHPETCSDLHKHLLPQFREQVGAGKNVHLLPAPPPYGGSRGGAVVRMTRKAVVGTCPGCGSRTVRGELDDGTLVEAEVGNLTAADELRAWATGVPTYRAVWKLHIQLDPRADKDLKLNPAGYDGARIWKQHTCTTTEGNTA